jgi:histidyl-tRNA synthetase
MGPVWRGENTAHGRYREFWQCDFDTIGTTSNAADIETVLVINDLMTGLGFKNFEIRVNNRRVLNGFLALHDLEDKATAVLRSLDKLSKIGKDNVVLEMKETAGIDLALGLAVVKLVSEKSGPNERLLVEIQQWLSNIAESKGAQRKTAVEGVLQLSELLKVAKRAGVPESRIKVDLSISRGLDYYTGTIYETFLLDKPDIGSVCSGGRYDNLASLYTKQILPGVGASLGLDRLLAAMEELGMLAKEVSTPAPVIVFNMAAECLGDYQRIARILRARDIGVEVYPEAKKLGQQFQYAERRGHKLAIIAGGDEFARNVCNLKILGTDKRIDAIPEAELAQKIQELLLAT